MKDYTEIPETKEKPTVPKSEGKPETRHGMAAMQGQADVSQPCADQSYQDSKGRELTMRTYPAGDQHFVRVYDKAKTPHLPESATFGDAGRANLRMERDLQGNVRAHLQDIETLPGYQESGTGSVMLKECERIAKTNHAQEIYGLAPDDEKTRQWYAKRGYEFRKANGGGTDVYKKLPSS